ncbi:hypothetical protein SAMN05519103_09684 [Rhizobiales bacterium GAS113]|nr:hypothetical protein SAMN05519103_09684 [Rhizobiales bacterium GAS113]
MAAAPVNAQVEVDLYLHVRVLISIILGLAVARLVGGVAGFIQHPGRDRIGLIHLGWVAWALLNVITFWWWEFLLSRVTHWTFALYVFIFLYTSTYFLLSVLLFPDDIIGYKGYDDYLLSRRGWFFGIIATTEALDVVDTLIKGGEHFRSLGIMYPIRILAFIVLCLIATQTRNLKFHAVFVVSGLIYEAIFFVRYFESLS